MRSCSVPDACAPSSCDDAAPRSNRCDLSRAACTREPRVEGRGDGGCSYAVSDVACDVRLEDLDRVDFDVRSAGCPAGAWAGVYAFERDNWSPSTHIDFVETATDDARGVYTNFAGQYSALQWPSADIGNFERHVTARFAPAGRNADGKRLVNVHVGVCAVGSGTCDVPEPGGKPPADVASAYGMPSSGAPLQFVVDYWGDFLQPNATKPECSLEISNFAIKRRVDAD
jgi:hypothetical protein